ncbi:hypothetical protein [Micromonospora sp. RTGN7]|uniref:hypothetical protein n=1 Tax=Micromonospora sp. RTGN7 TaxID=3016526 RepID=UPI0029FED029|nr:hypothetical protein [Micromonospora sp. RTGN7]
MRVLGDLVGGERADNAGEAALAAVRAGAADIPLEVAEAPVGGEGRLATRLTGSASRRRNRPPPGRARCRILCPRKEAA